MAIIDELVAKDCIDHDAAPGEPSGVEGVKLTHSMLLKAFPDRRFTVDFTVAEGDIVAARWAFRGTHKGEFIGVAPTGKEIRFTGTGAYRIKGGKIVEHWLNHDALGLMQQLGGIPRSG